MLSSCALCIGAFVVLPQLGLHRIIVGALILVPATIAARLFGERGGVACALALVAIRAGVASLLDPTYAVDRNVLLGGAFVVFVGYVVGRAETLRQRSTSAELLRAQSEARLHALLRALPDVLIRVGAEDAVLDVFTPPGLPNGPDVAAWALGESSAGLRPELLPVVRGARGRGLAMAEIDVDLQGVSRLELRGVGDERGQVLLLIADGSARKTLEARLVQIEGEWVLATTRARLAETERLAALGTLAAGIAHEINNPMTYIATNLQFALEEIADLPELVEARQSLLDAQAGAARVVAIVKGMKRLSRQPGAETTTVVDVQQTLEAAINLSKGALSGRMSLVSELTRVPGVRGSEAQLCQVFVNLLVNAAQAMPPERAASENRLGVSCRELGGQVEIVVEDNGLGMSSEVRAKAFDPFFTTKPVGVGTGLGLPICRTIVEKMGGEVRVESTEGQGTRVVVQLPIAP